jgi:hypothetical protein
MNTERELTDEEKLAEDMSGLDTRVTVKKDRVAGSVIRAEFDAGWARGVLVGAVKDDERASRLKRGVTFAELTEWIGHEPTTWSPTV